MDNTNTASPLPEPSGANNPNLSVVPGEGAPKRQRGDYNKETEADLSAAAEICAQAQKPAYAGELLKKKIDAPFVTALLTLLAEAGVKSKDAVNADGSRMDAVDGKSDAKEDLLNNLKTIQSAARLEHLPEHPGKLHVYGVGKDLDVKKEILERNSLTMIDKANEERPGELDTAFIEDTRAMRTKFMQQDGSKGSHVSTGKQARASRQALLRTITARRKKIQYAADVLWPHYKPTSAQARSDFKLPQNRPYSY